MSSLSDRLKSILNYVAQQVKTIVPNTFLSTRERINPPCAFITIADHHIDQLSLDSVRHECRINVAIMHESPDIETGYLELIDKLCSVREVLQQDRTLGGLVIDSLITRLSFPERQYFRHIGILTLVCWWRE